MRPSNKSSEHNCIEDGEHITEYVDMMAAGEPLSVQRAWDSSVLAAWESSMSPILHAECTAKMGSDWMRSGYHQTVKVLGKCASTHKGVQLKLSRPNLHLTVKYARLADYAASFIDFVDKPESKSIGDVMHHRALICGLNEDLTACLREDADEAEKRFAERTQALKNIYIHLLIQASCFALLDFYV